MSRNAVIRWILLNVVMLGVLVTLIVYQNLVIQGQHDVIRIMMTNPYCMEPFRLR